jgi:prefoldin subunit 5
LKQDVAEAEKRYKKTLDKHNKIYRADMRKKIKKLKTTVSNIERKHQALI